MTYHLWSDGACSGNPGPGGWGVYIREDPSLRIIKLWGYDSETTNNRMELTGAIEALTWCCTQSAFHEKKIHITTDSTYVKQGITEWILTWKRNGWKNSQKKSVKNQDLWEKLDILNEKLRPQWHWIKGHAGHIENEHADERAQYGLLTKSFSAKN